MYFQKKTTCLALLILLSDHLSPKNYPLWQLRQVWRKRERWAFVGALVAIISLVISKLVSHKPITIYQGMDRVQVMIDRAVLGTLGIATIKMLFQLIHRQPLLSAFTSAFAGKMPYMTVGFVTYTFLEYAQTQYELAAEASNSLLHRPINDI